MSEPPARKWWALAAVCFGLFMALLDITIVNVALPDIQKSLQEPFSNLQWIVNAYALVFAVLLVPLSRLGDIFGRKRVFATGLGIFSLGSLLCALSGHIDLFGIGHASVLNVFRGLQGVGSAAMLPLSLAIISATFHGRQRGAAIGIWGGVSALATAFGPLAGGYLVLHLGWESIFYINVPIGLAGILLSAWAIRESRDEKAPRSIDFFGVVTFTVATFCLMLALIQGESLGWGSTEILSLFAGFVVFLVVFIVGELRIAHPMADPRLFLIPSYTGASVAVFALTAGFYSLFFFLTLYLQDYLGMNALQTGFRFLYLSAPVIIAAPLAGRQTHRIGPRVLIVVSMALLTASVLWMTRIGTSLQSSAWLVLLPAFLVAGIGSGMMNPPVSSLAVGTVPPNRVGMGSGVNNIARQLGIAFGIAFFGALLNIRYNAAVQSGIAAIPHLPAIAKSGIVNGLQHAGVIAGASGLKQAGSAYTSNPFFPSIQKVAHHAFIAGTREVFFVAAVMLFLGLVASYFLIKHDALHHEIEAAQGG